MSNKKRQRGYINVGPSGSELLGCAAVVAAFFTIVGIGLAMLAPKVWAWIKPILLEWLA